MQQRHDVPAEVLGGARREGGIEVAGHGKERTDDVVGLQAVRLDNGTQQLIGGGENRRGLVRLDRRRAADAVQAQRGWLGHGR
jgi:hypothetical protein